MRLKKILAMSIVLLMLLSNTVTTFAADSTIDVTRRGSICITLMESAEPHDVIHGASFKLYQVATAVFENGEVRYEFTEPFRGSGVELSNLAADGIGEHLASFAEQNEISADIGNADPEGRVVFSDLELSLYLVVQNGSVAGYFPTDPFIVSVPMSNPEGTGWVYDINANPKVLEKPVTPSTTELTVVKRWVGSGENKVNSVSVSLLRDGVAVETETLNAGNNWTFTWNELSANYRWSVTENMVSASYRVSYSFSGTTTTIINTYVQVVPDNPTSITVNKTWEDKGNEKRPSSVTVELWNGDALYGKVTLNAQKNWTYTWNNIPRSTKWQLYEVEIPEDYDAAYAIDGSVVTITNKYTPPKDPPLIQTGQLNWPVSVLASSGIVLMAVGLIMVWVKRKKNEDA